MNDGMIRCPGCHLHYTDTGCNQIQEHADCPHDCGICGKPIILDSVEPEHCAGHPMADLLRSLPNRPLRLKKYSD